MKTLTFVMTEKTWWNRVRKEIVCNDRYVDVTDFDTWTFKYGPDRYVVVTLDVADDYVLEVIDKVNNILAEEGETR